MDKKDFIPIGPFRGWVLQNFPFIEADFDALTNYQLWCKIVEYVNKIAYNEELLEDSNDELIDAFNELKTYVETYLENLDIEEYVNNALDEMAESGELTEIMESYVQVEGILAYNTLSDLKNADNLVEGSFTKIYGKLSYNDGLGCFYKIRLKTTLDVIDEDNIISLTNYPLLVGEKMTNKDIENINTNIGTLSNLSTTNKSNLVNAINEVDSNCDNNTTKIGTLDNLTTTEKSNLVGAINEVNTAVGNVVTSGNTGENYYVKYADGTMICYGQITPSITGGCTTPDGGMYESQEFPVTFAQNFISSPMSISLSAVRNSNDHVKINVYARSLSKSGFTSWNASHTSINSTGISTYYIAIGRWK